MCYELIKRFYEFFYMNVACRKVATVHFILYVQTSVTQFRVSPRWHVGEQDACRTPSLVAPGVTVSTRYGIPNTRQTFHTR